MSTPSGGNQPPHNPTSNNTTTTTTTTTTTNSTHFTHNNANPTNNPNNTTNTPNNPSQNPSNTPSAALREESFTVKNRQAADKQMTLQQLMREAQNYVETEAASTLKTFYTEGEVQRYKAEARAKYENSVRGRGKAAMTTYIAFARWEATVKEYDRSRAVFEEALSFDPYNVDLWFHYVNMEISHGAIQAARNVYRKATQTMPNQSKLWFKWLALEEKLGNSDNIRTIYTELAQTRIETGTVPPEKVFVMYIDFEIREKNFQNCVHVFEEYLATYPKPSTYMQYAQFALYNGHLVDVSGIINVKNDFKLNNNNDIFIAAHHSHTIKTSSDNDDSSFYSTKMGIGTEKRVLTPQIVLERAIQELKILPTLKKAQEFEQLHHHLLLSQLELGNRTSNGVKVSGNVGGLPLIHDAKDILMVQDKLQMMDYPEAALVDSVIELLLFWAELEEELQKRKLNSKSTQVNSNSSNFANPSTNSSNLPSFSLDGSSLPTTSLISMAQSRQVLYFALKHSPLRVQPTVLNSLLSFEKRNGDTVMLDLALLHSTRLRYQDTLGISYPSLLKLLLPSVPSNGVDSESVNEKKDVITFGAKDKNGKSGKNANFRTTIINCSPAAVITRTIINGRLVSTVPILSLGHLGELQPMVRDYDTWLEWARVEQCHVQEQADMYALYTGNITNALLVKLIKQGTISRRGDMDEGLEKLIKEVENEMEVEKNLNLNKNDKNDKKSQNSSQPPHSSTESTKLQFSPIPPELSHLHQDVLNVYRTASKFIPITPQKSTHLSNLGQKSTHLSNLDQKSTNLDPKSTPPAQTYIISTSKSDWRRFVYIAISHAIYLELYCNDIEQSKQVYLNFLDKIPKNTFTFSSIWINLALTHLRLRVEQYSSAISQRESGMDDGIDDIEWEKKEKGFYFDTVKEIRSIFGRAIGLVKTILSQKNTQKMSELSINLTGEVDGDGGAHDDGFNVKLFLAYTNFEQKIHDFTRVRELFNSFLGDFATDFKLWKAYISFENGTASNTERARGLVRIALGLDRILMTQIVPHQQIITNSTPFSSIFEQDRDGMGHFVPQASHIDTSRYIVPMIQYKQFSDKLEQEKHQKALSTITNQLPLSRQIVPATSPIITTPSEVESLWELYTQLEINQILVKNRQNKAYWAQIASSYRKSLESLWKENEVGAVMRLFQQSIHSKANNTIFYPHQQYQFISCIPYLSALFPSLYDVCIAFESWILTQPLNVVPYVKYAHFWAKIGTILKPKGSKKALKPSNPQKRDLMGASVDGGSENGPDSTPIVSRLSSQTITNLLLIDFNSLFLSTLGTTTPPTAPLASLEPVMAAVSLDEYCFNVGRYILSLFHYRTVIEVKIVRKVVDQLLGQVNVIAGEINALDIKSNEELTMMGIKGESGQNGDENDNMMNIQQLIQKNNDEIARLGEICFELLLNYRNLLQHVFGLQSKRKSVLAEMRVYEGSYGTEETYNYIKTQYPTAIKKSMTIMTPRDDVGKDKDAGKDDGNDGKDDQERKMAFSGQVDDENDINNTNNTTNTTNTNPNVTTGLSMLENSIIEVGQIVQKRWRTEHYDYIDLVFPLDSYVPSSSITTTTTSGTTSATTTTSTGDNVVVEKKGAFGKFKLGAKKLKENLAAIARGNIDDDNNNATEVQKNEKSENVENVENGQNQNGENILNNNNNTQLDPNQHVSLIPPGITTVQQSSLQHTTSGVSNKMNNDADDAMPMLEKNEENNSKQ